MLRPKSSPKPRTSQPLTISHQFSISNEPVLQLSSLPPNTLLINKRHLSHSFKEDASIPLPSTPPEPTHSPPILNRLRRQYLSLVEANNYLQSLVGDKIDNSRSQGHLQNNTRVKPRRLKVKAPSKREETQTGHNFLGQRRKSYEEDYTSYQRLRQNRLKKRFFNSKEEVEEVQREKSGDILDTHLSKSAKKEKRSRNHTSSNWKTI